MKKLMDFNYSHVLVLGMAKSGTAAAKLLLANEINVRVNDMKATENDEITRTLQSMGAEVIVGSHPLSVLNDIEVIIKNPGIPYENPIVEEAQNRNIPIITEIELAGRLVEESIIGITGSNGKTTTTTLTEAMLAESNQPVKVAGNIGTVATDVADSLVENEKLVLELSSFQLLGIEKFKPKIAVLLNIYEAHIDYHKTFENYRNAKYAIFKNQTSEDYLIYNVDDPNLVEAVKHAKSRKVPFSVTKKLANGAWIDAESIYFKDEKIMDRESIVLVGTHNLENIVASVAAAKLSGASNEGIQRVLKTFSGVKHRLQYVDKVNGRFFYNDSKATNILATQKALSSFKQPIILLAGGLDRGNEFTDLIPFLKSVKVIVVFGETADRLKSLAEDAGVPVIVKVSDVTSATVKAYQVSEEGDVILLSPACASWDQYRTFEERGDMFIQAVHTLV